MCISHDRCQGEKVTENILPNYTCIISCPDLGCQLCQRCCSFSTTWEATIKRLIKQKTHEKFFQEAIASSNKKQWQNIKSTWENNKNIPRKQAVANFWLYTGHDWLAAHLHHIKIFSHNYCTICKLKNTIMDKDHLLECPKLDHTSKELSKL